MFLKRIISLTALILLSSQAVADSSMPNPNQYFGIAAGQADIEPDSSVGFDGVTDIKLKAGYDFSKFFSIEVHLGGAGLISDKDPDLFYTGGFVRGNLPLNSRVNLYGLAGGVYLDDSDNVFGDSYAEPAIGVGIELYGSDETAIMLEYVQYGLDDVYKTIGVGLAHHFDWPGIR